MKPFGIRLAAGAVTILLGAIMAGQAQKNLEKNDSDASWDITSSDSDQPPKPIAAMNSEEWLSAPDVKQPSPENPFPKSDGGAVQLVQHTEPIEDAENANAQQPSLLVPDELPTFEVPDQAPAGGSQSAPAMQLPGEDLTPAADDAGGAASISLPGLEVPTDGGPLEQAPGSPAKSPAESPLGNDSNGAPALPELPDMPTPDAAPGLSPGAAPGLGPAVTLGGPSLMPTETPTAASEENSGLPVGGQPGNILRGGSGGGNALRESGAAIPGGTAAGAVGSELGSTDQPPPNAATSDSSPMIRAIAMPGAPGSPAPGQSQAAQGMPRTNSNLGANQTPAIRIVTPADGHPGGAAKGAPNFAGGQNHFGDTSFNQPAANYGPAHGNPAHGNPAHGNPARGNPAHGRGPVAPALPSARIASLPNQTQIGSPGIQPQSYAGPHSAAPPNVDPNATLASPGDRRFDGVQSPSIVIHKRAPAEVKVGKPANFVIHVQNVGQVEAMDVRVSDRIPAGMQLVDASPSPIQQADVLLWQLGSMKAGDERTVTMKLVPMQEGELGSVARVTFEAAASVRTISTRPELKIVQQTNEKVLIGQQLEIDLEIANTGTGDATGVIIQEDVPEGLEHPKGRQLDNAIGTLRAGEVRRQVLRLRAVAPGIIQNTILLKGDDGLEASHTVNVEVVAPQLQVDLQGPSRRFLERQATYELVIANSGTAEASNIEIAAYLDRGFSFVGTDYQGQYDESRHAVFWSLANLPVGETGKVPLTLLPVREGERAIRLEARADLGLVAKNERTVNVDALAELTFQITDSADPIEVGGETMYEIRLTNSGSRNDSNVRVQLQLPQGVELLSSDADADTDGRGLVAFAPKSELAAGSDIVYRVKARGTAPGTHLIKAVVLSDQSQVPVTKEESTMVYADR